MKIQNKSKMKLRVYLFIGVAFFVVFHLREKRESVVLQRPPIAQAQNNVNSMTVLKVKAPPPSFSGNGAFHIQSITPSIGVNNKNSLSV